MNEQRIVDPVASGPDLSRLWYADPTGETAVRNLMASTKSDDFAVVDSRGNVVFRIKPNVLAALLPFLHFTLTRRGRNTIRAHKKNAPGAVAAAREGDGIHP
ncbi:hypothetical protein GCM10022219_11510 [Microbacterium oryzae]|uniref:Uncharacterized protein n=1 Tax=Microbacterium oryzae TaxID=743009 RepID=A0A6I6E6R9_9MICO|nr:hypothetical protein [Microbacterium oryzae]QGU28477.1 hypothetical protein D7D94_12945 [Microbacterium oryzae]